MTVGPDLVCSGGILALTVLVFLAYGARALGGGRGRRGPSGGGADEKRPGLPGWVKELSRWALDPVVRGLIAGGVSASAITSAALVLGMASAVLLALGHFGVASLVFVVASLGDTLDGQVARQTQTAGPAGALFDASVDRYEEFFTFFGLAVFFRERAWFVAAVFFALLGSFMVSYGSAKAEAFKVTVPAGWMRRAERAVVVAVGILLVPPVAAAAAAFGAPAWVGYAPVWGAVVLVAIVANASAVFRLRRIAAAAVAAAAPPKAKAPE